MGIFNKFKKQDEKVKTEAQSAKVVTEKPEIKKPVAPVEKKEIKHSKEDTKEAYRYLLRPIMTEKVSNLGALGKYVFEVAPQANKVEISKAIVALYGVKPVKVNIIRLLGKSVRYGRTTGKTKDWKKAVITLKAGETIQVYEGV